MKTVKTSSGLNEIQIGLLRMFDRKIPDEEVIEIKKLLSKHLSKKLFDEVDRVVEENRVVEEKGISDNDYEKLK